MKKLLLLPAMLFPYSFVLGFIFSEGYAGGDSAMVALAVFVGVFLILPFACNIAFIILSRKDEPYKLIQSALIVKLVHIIPDDFYDTPFDNYVYTVRLYGFDNEQLYFCFCVGKKHKKQ